MGALYLISGGEEFSVKERAVSLVHELFGDAPEEDSSLEIIRGDEDSEKFSDILERVIDSIQTPSFLSPVKTVWLKHFSKFDEAFAENSTKKKPSRIDILGDLLKDGMPQDVTLIIDGPNLDRRKAFYKLCSQLCETSGGKLEWFEKADPKMKGFIQLLVRRAKEQALNAGKRMDDEAASFLAETVGNDTPRMKNEIDKLIAHSGDSKFITLDDCFRICSKNTETLAWEFSGALAERNASKALSLIPGIIQGIEQERGASSNPEMAIVGSAHSEFKRLLALKCAGAKYNIPSSASPDFFYSLSDKHKESDPGNPIFAMHPFRAYKSWENTSRFSDVDFARIFEALLAANRTMVTTSSNPRIVLETLVLRIVGTN